MKYGRYQIVRELGKGSMGVVYQAHDPHIDRLVALKALRQDRVTSEDFVQRFLKEAKAIGRLSHPNIVTVYDVGRDHGTIYIAMEFLEGNPLNEVIQGKRLGLEEIVDLGVQVAEALDYAHEKGIVHRDIKPTNIILTPDGQARITDFGIARIEDSSVTQQTQAGEILGTPVYMSPEQVMGRPVDGRSDLYSLGVILYELSTQKRPFGGNNLAAIFRAITQDTPAEPAKTDSSISRELSGLVMKSLDRRPDKRFQTGKAMAEALKACLKVKKSKALPPKPIKKKPKPLGLVVFIAFIVVSVAGGLAYYFTAKERPEQSIPSALESPLHDESPSAVEVAMPALLKVDSVPTGAQVFLDGSFKGKTPMKFELPFGKYEVRLSLPDYDEWEAHLQLNKVGETPLFVRLNPIDKKNP
jgi:serine/threonine protein kinase